MIYFIGTQRFFFLSLSLSVSLFCRRVTFFSSLLHVLLVCLCIGIAACPINIGTRKKKLINLRRNPMASNKFVDFQRFVVISNIDIFNLVHFSLRFFISRFVFFLSLLSLQLMIPCRTYSHLTPYGMHTLFNLKERKMCFSHFQ